MTTWVILLSSLWVIAQIAVGVLLIWVSWRFFDQRYKKNTAKQPEMLSGSLEPTSEVFIDPKDNNRYRVYYNRASGEREYIREDS